MSIVSPARLSRARLAVTFAFIVHGMVFSSWLPHIPGVKNGLDLTEGGLGLILLATPAGAIVAMPLSGAACARWGSALVTQVSLVAYALGISAIGVGATSRIGLVLALLLSGALVGSFDVAMNAQAATVERAMGKPIMGSFHAIWSLAAAAGAAMGGWIATIDPDLLGTQLLALGMFAMLAALPLFTSFLPDEAHESGAPKQKWRFERGLILLCGVAFAGLLAEGAVADWSAVFLAEDMLASPMVAGWGYAVFSLAMFAGRLAGDRLVGRFGRSRSIATAAYTGGGGMAIGLIIAEVAGPGVPGQVATIGGLLVLGLGLAVIVPVVVTAVGDGPGIATVSTGGYTGWLLGPAVIGGLGEWLGLPVAMWAVPVLAIAVGAVAPIGIRALRSPATVKSSRQ